jgi:hypothetical protein
LDVIHFDGKEYKNCQLDYPYAKFIAEFDSLEYNQNQFLKSLNTPSEFEWSEIKTLCKSYYLLSQKAAFTYLIQLYISAKYNLANQVSVVVDNSNHLLKPNETFTFNVNSSVPFSTNFSIQSYYFDDSLIYDYYTFNDYFIDSILVPTNEIGMHQIKGAKYFGRVSHKTDSIFYYTYNYEVIENK